VSCKADSYPERDADHWQFSALFLSFIAILSYGTNYPPGMFLLTVHYSCIIDNDRDSPSYCFFAFQVAFFLLLSMNNGHLLLFVPCDLHYIAANVGLGANVPVQSSLHLGRN
jgi:hypothetical protein